MRSILVILKDAHTQLIPNLHLSSGVFVGTGQETSSKLRHTVTPLKTMVKRLERPVKTVLNSEKTCLKS